MTRRPLRQLRRKRRVPRSCAAPPNKYARWRAISLLGVHVLIFMHIVHWKLSGKTLAPLEFNEVMHALELGIVTAGFLFMMAAVLATAIVGRFFCSWGCHILALQDLSAWMLGKIGIRPKPIRSRLLLWVPMIAAAYMFVWPQVSRIAQGTERASMRVATDADGWASFVTENFWRNLPGPGIALTTFFVCGFLIVYMLGTRSFCAYGCPYGAVFGLADRLAPGRIRVGPDCTQCAKCTAACTSHVRVHEEVERYGMVVNPACMKDFDCINACPQQTLRFGFGRPSLLKRIVGTKQVQKLFDFSLAEELLAGMVFVIILFTYRGLYDLVPFLLSLAIAALLSYAAIIVVRLFTRADVRFNRWALRRSGAMTSFGKLFVAAAMPVVGFTMHSAWVHYNVFRGQQLYQSALGTQEVDSEAVDQSILCLSRGASWGLIVPDRVERMLGDLFTARKDWTNAESSRRRSLAVSPHDPLLLAKLGSVLSHQERFASAEMMFQRAIELEDACAESYHGLAVAQYKQGKRQLAVLSLQKALQRNPDFVEAHYQMGTISIEIGAHERGIHHLEECVRLRPEFGDGHYNLAVALASAGRLTEAATAIDQALKIQPDDSQTQAFRSFLKTLVPIEAWPNRSDRMGASSIHVEQSSERTH